MQQTDAYKVALAAARFLAAVNLIVSLFLTLLIVATMFLNLVLPGPGPAPSTPPLDLSYVAVTIGTYVVLYFVAGLAVLLCAPGIARFAAKAFRA